MGSEQNMRPQTGLISVPRNYPTVPTPGKLQLLLENNTKSIYHRFSPYAEYQDGLVDKILGFGSKQPYIYHYIDEAKRGLSGLRRYESRNFPVGSGPLDVIRVSKFIGSGPGLVFLGKQFLLQSGQAFNETRIYNPTSPIVAAATGLTFGWIRPQRNFDTSGGLIGIAKTLIGDRIPNLLGGDTAVGVPSGTAGAGALPDANKKTDGKGLTRGDTAGRGWTHFTQKWTPTTSKFSWKEAAKNVIRSFLPSTFNLKQPTGTIFRADEGAYGIMLSAGERFRYIGESGGEFGFGQVWVAGGKGMRKQSQYTSLPYKLVIKPDGTLEVKPASGGIFGYIQGIGAVGYEIAPSKNELSPGVRYGDSVGVEKGEDYEASDAMIQYESYAKSSNQFLTKQIDRKAIDKKNENLQAVIKSLQKSGVYQVTSNANSPVLPTGTNTDPNTNGYNRILSQIKVQPGVSPLNYPNGVLSEYRAKNIRMVDNSLTNDAVNKSLKLPGAGNFDAINTLKVLPGPKSENDRRIAGTSIPGWNKWEPYRDDQIAFFFYDAVNDKYIPFRATVKGINEQAAAGWEELTFIGRADRLYSYGGFTRQLTFSFDIVISSIIELSPTWKRINYLMSLVKPSRYTKSKPIDGKEMQYNRFMIPPMVFLTIGDLYKKQPVMLNNVSLAIPDDAAWETLNEENMAGKDWSYLVDYIKNAQKKPFGQFPREAKITVSAYLLEKERAIVGAANFGHAPHTDAYDRNDIDSYPAMDRELVTYQYERDGG